MQTLHFINHMQFIYISLSTTCKPAHQIHASPPRLFFHKQILVSASNHSQRHTMNSCLLYSHANRSAPTAACLHTPVPDLHQVFTLHQSTPVAPAWNFSRSASTPPWALAAASPDWALPPSWAAPGHLATRLVANRRTTRCYIPRPVLISPSSVEHAAD